VDDYVLGPQAFDPIGWLPAIRWQIVGGQVWSLRVVVVYILADDVSQVLFAQHDEPVETLLLDRLHEPLGMGVLVRCPYGCLDHLDALGLEDVAKLPSELRVVVADKVAGRLRLILEEHTHVAGLLGHPPGIGIGCDPGDVHSPRGEAE